MHLAEIQVDPTKLDNYKAALTEEIETSVRLEPGVLGLYAMSEKDDPAHRHCQVNRCEDVCGQSEGDSEPSRCSMDAGFLSPSPEGLRANASIAGCGHEMAPRPEVAVDHRMRRQKPLCLAG